MRLWLAAVMLCGCGRLGFDPLADQAPPNGGIPAMTLEFLAGDIGGPGSADGVGADARFNDPQGVAVDRTGVVYVADSGNFTIRKIAIDGTVTTLAGSPGVSGGADGAGAAARFTGPLSLAVDDAGNVFVSDQCTIRKVTPEGVVTTLAGSAGMFGSADGTGAAARFNVASGIAIDGQGNLFVIDALNNTIRQVSPSGGVTTLAGTAGVSGTADGTGPAAQFSGLSKVAIDGTGNLYVADRAAVRKITPGGVVTTIVAGSPIPQFFFAIAIDAEGNLYLDADDAIRKITPAGTMMIVAGAQGVRGSVDGRGSFARFNSIAGVASDASGNLYIAEAGGDVIRKLSTDGLVTTLAGRASLSGGVDGAGAAARFSQPRGVAVDRAGNLYIADTQNDTVRKITADGVVTTLAGAAGQFGSADGNGSEARLGAPEAVAVDDGGDLYVVSPFDETLRKITADGMVTTPAGCSEVSGSADGAGPAARFSAPTGVSVDSTGTIYVVDSENATIRNVTPDGVVSTLAGNAGQRGSVDGAGASARFAAPSSAAVDANGNLYVSDGGTIRKVGPDGTVTTLAGAAGETGYADGAGSVARFGFIGGLAVDGAGNLYVADGANSAIRKVTPDGLVSTVVGQPGVAGIVLGDAPRLSQPVGVAVAGDALVILDLAAVLVLRHGVRSQVP